MTVLDLLLKSTKKCKKDTIFDNLRTITQKGDMKTRQMTTFFSSAFRSLTVSESHFSVWKLSKLIFIGSPLSPIMVCKIPEFWRWKLWLQDFVSFNSENIHFEESKKNKFYFFYRVENKFQNFKGNPMVYFHGKCGALLDLVAFVQFKKRKKHPWRSVNFSKVAGWSQAEHSSLGVFHIF